MLPVLIYSMLGVLLSLMLNKKLSSLRQYLVLLPKQILIPKNFSFRLFYFFYFILFFFFFEQKENGKKIKLYIGITLLTLTAFRMSFYLMMVYLKMCV